MSYCTLEEAWGSDFKKKHRKSKKEKRLEALEKKRLDDAIDPQILIPETQRSNQMADYRREVIQSNPDRSNIQGFDESDKFMSPYQRYAPEQVQRSNESVLASQQVEQSNRVLASQQVEQSNRVLASQQVEQSNRVLASQQVRKPRQSSLISDIEKPLDQFVKISKQEYEQLKHRLVEGFGNQTDEQFNQLLLFIFTGIFYLFSLDMMYQLGKKSY